jgi:hypothetical protein
VVLEFRYVRYPKGTTKPADREIGYIPSGEKCHSHAAAVTALWQLPAAFDVSYRAAGGPTVSRIGYVDGGARGVSGGLSGEDPNACQAAPARSTTNSTIINP